MTQHLLGNMGENVLIGRNGLIDKMVIVFALIAAAICIASGDAKACADGYSCAVIRETPDGFVNLRSRPNASAPVKQTLKPYEIVVIATSDCAPNRDTDSWTELVCVPRAPGGCDLRKTNGSLGWVNSRFLARTYCPTDLNQ